MTDTVLSLSLLGGHLKALAVQRGVLVGTWQRPTTVEDFTDFSSVVREAVAGTRYVGDAVSLVLAHPRLNQQLVETPPIHGFNLRWFLERRVKQLKTFNTDAAWSYQPTEPTKNARALVLHLFPKPFWDQLMEGCQQAGLHLTKLLPATAVLSRQLKELPIAEDELALVAADTGGTTTVIIGRKNGQVYLARSLSNSWSVYPDRVNVDLNRTILYVKQQFGATVNSLWLFGNVSEDNVRAMQAAVRVPVKTSPVQLSPFYWNQEAQKVADEDSNNLVSPELQKAPRRRVLLRVTGLLIGLLALGAVATAVFFQALVRDRLKQADRLQPRAEKLQGRKGDLQQREVDYYRQKEFLKLVSEERVQPVSGWFFGYLGEVVPEELLLTHFQIKRQTNQWTIELAGMLQPTTNPAPAAVLAGAVSSLRDRLSSGPFQVKITRTVGVPEGPASTVKRISRTVAGATGGSTADKENRFVIEGAMR